MKDNLSPEEKLLNLIKGDKKGVSAGSPAQNTPAAGKKPSPRQAVKPFKNTHFTLLSLKRLIQVVTGISFIYLILAFIYPSLGLKEVKLTGTPADQANTKESDFISENKTMPYEFYRQGLGQRQIFANNNLIQEGATAPSIAGTDLIKDINLVGIISGDNPQAVIEDKKTLKTYYLNQGQSIGELQIEEIKEGRIILNCKGQKYELYL